MRQKTEYDSIAQKSLKEGWNADLHAGRTVDTGVSMARIKKVAQRKMANKAMPPLQKVSQRLKESTISSKQKSELDVAAARIKAGKGSDTDKKNLHYAKSKLGYGDYNRQINVINKLRKKQGLGKGVPREKTRKIKANIT